MIATKNFTTVDKINSKNGLSMKECDGVVMTAKKIAVIEKQTEEGAQEVGVVITPDDTVYTTISMSAIDTLKDCISLLDSDSEWGGDTVDIKIEVRQSKNGRGFLSLTVVQ